MAHSAVYKLASNQTTAPSYICHSPFWDYDDMDLCHRQVYFESYGVALTLGIALIYTLYALWNWRASGEVALNSETADASKLFFHPSDSPDPTSRIKIQVRRISDRLRLVAEVAANTLIVVAAMILAMDDTKSGQYVFAPRAPMLFVMFAAYLWALSVHRLVHWKQINTLVAQPFLQLAILYVAEVSVSATKWYSELMQPSGGAITRLTTLIVALSLLNWVVLWSSPIGDHLPRLYVSKDEDGATAPYNQPSPEISSSLFRIIVASWSQDQILLARRRVLTYDDVMELEEGDHSYVYVQRYMELPSEWSYSYRMLYIAAWPLVLNNFYGIMLMVVKLTPTIFIQKLLVFLETRDVPMSTAWLYVFFLGLCFFMQSVFYNLSLYLGRKISVGIRAMTIAAILRKALHSPVSLTKKRADADYDDQPHNENGEDVDAEGAMLAPSPSNSSTSSSSSSSSDEDESDASTGAVLNLMSVDNYKLSEFSAYFHDITSVPALLVMTIYFLYKVLGWSAFVAVAVMLLAFPCTGYLGGCIAKAQHDLMAQTDLRIDKTNEILDAIRIVKCYAWERRLSERVYEIRDEELRLLMRKVMFWSMNSVVLLMFPILVAVTTFWTYVRIQGGVLTASTAFTALTVLAVLRAPLSDLSNIYMTGSSAYVSLNRINTYLSTRETAKHETLETLEVDGVPFIGFRDSASFSWADPDNLDADTFRLRDLDLSFPNGDLSIIIGPTGSGKTSLLMALLGEMHRERGHVYLPSSPRDSAPVDPATGLTETVAYVPQQAWLLNDTIRANILFGHRFQRQRYEAVIDACELRRDLDILDAGDQTLIGDKGIALSGGQKQRVSVARALYSNSRHLLLDDCLSAVDAHTALALYDKALTGPLVAQRTVVLVSHNVALTISRALHVVVMDNGRVTAHGPPGVLAASGQLGGDALVTRNAQSAAQSRMESRQTSRAQSRAQSRDASRQGSEAPEAHQAELYGHLARPQHEPHVGGAQHRHIAGDSDVPGLPGLPAVVHPFAENEYDAGTGEGADDELTQEARHAKEAQATGAVPLDTYTAYLRMLGTPFQIFLLILPVILTSYIEYMLSWWVKQWAASMGGGNETDAALAGVLSLSRRVQHAVWPLAAPAVSEISHETLVNLRFYSIGYILIGVLAVMMAAVRDLSVQWLAIRAARRTFRLLLERVTHARSRFFDTTPSGRIINRFSQDMVDVDQEIGPSLSWLSISAMDSMRVSIVLAWVTPVLIPSALFAFVAFVFIGQSYMAAARELKRMDSVSKSPIFQLFSESVSGSVVIRAYGDLHRFVSASMKSADTNHRAYLWLWLSNRWLAFWSSMLSLVTCVLAAAVILMQADTIDPGMAGISLSLSVSFGDAILWTVRMYASCEIEMNSVERVFEYTKIEQEAPGVIPDSRPPPNWPSRGAVEFRDLSLQYGPDLPLVIKHASFSISPGKKVGVVGRTGAGKSTIITALFRLLEPATGTVLIDDVDITTIGLEDLRKGLSIIPQEPTLFKGTLRSNLDMFDEYDDAKMLAALAQVGLVPPETTVETAALALTPTVSRTNAAAAAGEDAANEEEVNLNQFYDLNTEVAEGGRNISQGQRQLLCLARAVLKEPRILLLDEATASIDYDTDAIIQRTLRSQFNQATVLTIAHRLRTIADYDLILVLDRGEVMQFAHPYDLLQDKSGIFYSMCANSGEFEALVALAEKSKQKQ